MINPDRIYNTREASRLTMTRIAGVTLPAKSPGEFARLCRTGKLRAVKIGNQWAIPGYELRRYMIAIGLEVD